MKEFLMSIKSSFLVLGAAVGAFIISLRPGIQWGAMLVSIAVIVFILFKLYLYYRDNRRG